MEVKQIESFGLKDNDIVIVRVARTPNEEEREKIEKAWSGIFVQQGYLNVKVVVLGPSLGFQIITRQD